MIWLETLNKSSGCIIAHVCWYSGHDSVGSGSHLAMLHWRFRGRARERFMQLWWMFPNVSKQNNVKKSICLLCLTIYCLSFDARICVWNYSIKIRKIKTNNSTVINTESSNSCGSPPLLQTSMGPENVCGYVDCLTREHEKTEVVWFNLVLILFLYSTFNILCQTSFNRKKNLTDINHYREMLSYSNK